MAYGIKYLLRTESAKWKNDIRIQILEDGYGGSSSTKYLGAGGITLTKENGGRICGTTLEFTIQSDSNFEYLDFFEQDTRKYLVKLFINDATMTTPYWQGWLISDEYREEFISPPYDVHCRATDGLGLLKNYDYTTQTVATDTVSRLDIINNILENIGLSLPINISYDVTVDVSGTAYNVLYWLIFRDDYFENWTCYEVLEKMIPPDATITQHNNQWLIRRNEQDSEKTHTIYTPYEFKGETLFSTATGAGETVLNLAAIGAGDVYPIGSAELNMQPSWKSGTIVAEYGKRPSFIVNYNFEDGLNYWTQSTTGFATAESDESGYYVKLTGEFDENAEDVPDEYISQSFLYTSVTGEGFAIKFKYSITGYLALIGTGGYKNYQFVIKGRVSYTDGVDTYYLDETAGWSTTNKNFEIKDYGNIRGINWKDFAILTDEPPLTTGTMTVYLYAGITDANATLVDINFTDVIVKPIASDNYTDAFTYTIPMRTNGVETGEVNMLPGSGPNIENFTNIFYVVQTKNGEYIDEFTTNDAASAATTGTWDNIIINNLYWLNAAPRQILSGYFRGQNLSLNSVIQCAASSDRKYTMQSGAWDLSTDKIQSELIEIPGTATGSSWTIPTTDWASYGTWYESGTVSGKKGGGGGTAGGVGGGNYVSISWLEQYFKIVDEGTTGQYIQAQIDLASTGIIRSYNFGDDIGNGIPLQSASTTGAGVLMIGSGLQLEESGAWGLAPATNSTIGGVIIGTGLSVDTTGLISVTGGATGVSDHGALTGLEDDDHLQYLTTGRADYIYSATGHDHAGVYSPTGHDHAGVYSTTGHNHTGTYAPATHATGHHVTGSDSVFPADPGSDKYLMWDESESALVWSTVTASSGTTVSLGSVTGTTYTLVIGDAGKYIRCNNASGITITVPLNASVAFDSGTVISFEQQGAGTVTVSGETTGVTINAYDGKTTYGQYAGMQIVKVDTDVWTCIAGT